MSVYLPLSTQESIFLYFKITFVVSTTLNLLGLFLLLKQAPPNQSAIRYYLIRIQVLLLLADVHLDIGFHPIPLFPALAGYAVGFLIRLGLTTHVELAITIAFYIWMGMAMAFCILFKHQTFLREGNPLKLRPGHLHLLDFCSVLVPTILVAIYACNGMDAETVEILLNENPNNVTWIRDRGAYYVDERTDYIVIGMILVIFILIAGAAVTISLFAHMFHVLRKDSAMYSDQSLTAIRRSLRMMFVQMIIPFGLFIVPTITIFVSLVSETLLSFETTLGMFLILPCHSIGHNLILLSTCPCYRISIISTVKGIFTCGWEPPKKTSSIQSTVVI